MADQDFFSFDEALDELRLKEEELKRLVSEGEIRAFRDGDTMRLRRSDVDNLRSELSGGELVDLGDTATEELVFEDDADFDDAGMATEEISEMDTLLDDEIEDVGEVDEEVPDVAPAASTRSRRAPAAAPAEEEEVAESPGLLALMLATAVVLILALPVLISSGTGKVSGIAEAIAGMFGGGQ